MWDASKCNLCGDCLVRCQYVDFDKNRAVAEIKLLMEGKEADIIGKCITCFACNEWCPTGADPFDLIVKMQEKTGVSPLSHMPPLDGEIDFMKKPSVMIPGDPDKPVLSLCVMEPLSPQGYVSGRIFEGMPVVKGPEYFCHFAQLHLCRESVLSKNIKGFIDTMSGLGRDIVFVHDDCYSTVHRLAREYGVDIPFKYVHVLKYLRDYLVQNRDSITRLEKKIAYQRPCASRYTPEKDTLLDEIFELVGVRRVPRKYDRKDALCCSGAYGMAFPELAAGFLEKNVNDAVENGAEAMVTVCAGCDFSLKEPASQHNLKTIYITNLCRMAIGEESWPG